MTPTVPRPTPNRRPRGHHLALGALLALALVACDPPDDGNEASASADGLSVEAQVVDEPAVGPSEVEVTVHEGGEPVTDAEVEVTGDMTHAGMVPVVAPAPHDEGGRYRTEGFEFSMAGDWILTVTVRHQAEEAETTLEVAVPGE